MATHRIYKLDHTCSTTTAADLRLPTSACHQSPGALCDSTAMLPGRAADVRHCVLTSRWLPAALALLLLLSSSLGSAHSTTVEHDFHIVHNVDNRSPEIDPFWYVGRGVRPIGRFGKRHSGGRALGSGGLQPVVRTLELLLDSLRNKESLEKVLDGEGRDWLP